jgi:hypothetical protein
VRARLPLIILTLLSMLPATAIARADVVTDSDRAAARSAAQEILERPEFQRTSADRLNEAIQRWITEKMDALFRRLGGNGPTVASIAKVMAWTISIAALIALAVWLFRQRRAQHATTLAGLQAPTVRLTSREWAERARDALRAGDAREAIRCGYHAALFRLEEQGVWRVDDARTPREYLSLLKVEDARRGPLIELTRDFEYTWYGSRPADGHGLLERLEVLGCHAPSKPAI